MMLSKRRKMKKTMTISIYDAIIGYRRCTFKGLLVKVLRFTVINTTVILNTKNTLRCEV